MLLLSDAVLIASAVPQKMSAERNDLITRAQSGDHGGFAGYTHKVDGPEVHGRGGAVKDPKAGLLAVIEHSSEWHFHLWLVSLVRQPNGHRRAKGRCRSLAVEHVACLVGTGLSIGGIR